MRQPSKYADVAIQHGRKVVGTQLVSKGQVVDGRLGIGGHVADEHLPRIVAFGHPPRLLPTSTSACTEVGSSAGWSRAAIRTRPTNHAVARREAMCTRERSVARCRHGRSLHPPSLARQSGGTNGSVVVVWLVLGVVVIVWVPMVAVVRLVTAPSTKAAMPPGYLFRKADGCPPMA